MMRALIIDDEMPARAALRGLLQPHPEIVLVGEAGSILQARARLAQSDYDLVFLDVQLRGGSGFDLLPDIRPGAHIIFVTAFDQHAVRAFEVNALDYLIKPVRPERMTEALGRLAGRSPASPLPGLSQGDLVHLKIGSGTTRFVALADIAVIEAEENYSKVLLGDGTRLLVRRTMKEWEETLPASHFARVHRGTIINLARYRGAERPSYEMALLRLEGHPEPVHASFRYLPEMRRRLEALGLQF